MSRLFVIKSVYELVDCEMAMSVKNMFVYVTVGLSTDIHVTLKRHALTSPIFCACCLWLQLVPPLVALLFSFVDDIDFT